MRITTRTTPKHSPLSRSRNLGRCSYALAFVLLWAACGVCGAANGHDLEPPLPGEPYVADESNVRERGNRDMPESSTAGDDSARSLSYLMEPGQAWASVRTIGLLTILSLAPAIALMTTSYVRVAIVLMLLRQGLGAQGLPSNQIISALALFISAVIMTPVWTVIYEDAVVPYTADEGMTLDEAWAAGVQPVRQFMSRQIDALGNSEDIWLFYRYLPQNSELPKTYDEVPLTALLPAFMLSELKTAFLIGFQIYLPFLMLDILVASVTVSMGMFMLPPAFVSLPFKLLLFVMVDGWHLLVEMLLKSFVP